MLEQVLDLSTDVTDLTFSFISELEPDLFSRKPKLKFDSELWSDLDLSTIMLSLAKRNAVVNIPKYERQRPKCWDGRILLDENNRHGIITSLSSNQNTFSFSARIIDQQVVDTDKTGFFRLFMLTDFYGNLYPGWDRIDFFPTEENEFLNNNKIWTKIKTLTLKYFIHPNRWRSFFSKRYFLVKALVQRLELENNFFRTELKRLEELGVPYPKIEDEYPKAKDWPKKTYDDYKSIKVQCFQSKVDVEFNNDFLSYKEEPDSYLHIWNKRKVNRYKLLPKLRYYIRCCELAFYTKVKDNLEEFCLKEGVEDYKLPRKRIVWKKLQTESGIILFRTYLKTEKVPKEEETK